MFGYLDIEKQKLNDGQQGLWQSFMCGLCLSTKRLLGNIPRMVISNDVNFFNVLFHSVLNVDVQVEHNRCFSHPFKKQAMLSSTELMDRLAVANVLLTRWNLYDDVVDDKSIAKKLAMSVLGKSYKKAQALCEKMDQMMQKHCTKLQELEKANCDSVDVVSHCFAMLSQEFCEIILDDKVNEHSKVLAYNLGKWIYLIDALDDLPKDVKQHKYNPFVACYKLTNKRQVVQHLDEIQFTMFAVLNRIVQCFNDLSLTKYTCILKNVLFESIRNKTKNILQNLRKIGETK